MSLWSTYAKLRQRGAARNAEREGAAFDARVAQRREPGATPVAAFVPGGDSAWEAADAEWERQRAEHQARLDGEVLGGPAGAHFWGTVPDLPKPSEAHRNAGSVGDQIKQSFRDLRDTAAGLADPKALLGIGSEFGPEIADPAQRRAIADAERAARDAARAPYVAAERSPVVFTRIATTGGTQFDELAGQLAATGLAARPDLVFGVYRVPDRIDPKKPGAEKGRVVEWDVVHAPSSRLPAAAPPVRVRFDGETRWVRRRTREPSVLDEDLALAWLASAGIGPEHCLGVAREVVMQSSDGWFGESDLAHATADVYGRVEGVSVLLAAGHPPAPRAPIDVPFDGVRGTHVEVLNWAAVARAVHPRPQRLPETPSPFPYLPATPQELLAAYLDVVGVHPADCFGASITIDRFSEYGEVRAIREDQMSLAGLKLTDATPLPCADGRDRRRLHGASRVVVSYRDSARYEQGRLRWRDYQRDVLFARLHLKTDVRLPIGATHDDLGAFGGVVRTVDRLGETFDRVTSLRWKDPAHIRFRDQARYCMPLD